MSKGRLLVTGDVHFPIDKYKLDKLALMGYSKDDILLVCGDFGGVWYPRNTAAQLSREQAIFEYPFTIAWCDGNHENFDSLATYPVIQRYDSQVHMITKNCFHLMRGMVYTIKGKRVFSFGGAMSTDKSYRVMGRSWWAQEIPSEKDFETAAWQLRMFKNNVDFIITHDAPACILSFIYGSDTIILPHNEVFDKWLRMLTFRNWFFGHHHINCTYDNIIFAVDSPCRLNFDKPLVGLYNSVLDITGDTPKLIL